MVKNAKYDKNPMEIDEKASLTNNKESIGLGSLNVKDIAELKKEVCCTDNKDKIPKSETKESVLFDETVPNAKSHKFILQRRRLDEIPQDIQRIHNLTSIDLQTNQIRSMSRLSSITTLETVNLSDNLIHKIEYLENVRSLDLGYNLIQKIENLSDTIEHLYLMSNDIVHICNLPRNLLTLDIAGNEITKVENLGHLHRIRELYLGNNLIETIGAVKEEKYQIQDTDTELEERNMEERNLDIKHKEKISSQSEQKHISQQKSVKEENTTIQKMDKSEKECESDEENKKLIDPQLRSEYPKPLSTRASNCIEKVSQSDKQIVLQSLANCHTLSLQSNRLISIDCSYLPPNLKYLCISENPDLKEIRNLDCLKQLVYLDIWRTGLEIDIDGVEIVK